MKLAEIKEILQCQAISKLSDVDLDIEIRHAYASDLMSDVLRLPKRGALLLTGLTNSQVVRTCKVAASCAVIFVRGKNPTADTVKLAGQYNIPVLTTELCMFDACGILFANGIKGIAAKK
jgi:predicted transcriptional regulator